MAGEKIIKEYRGIRDLVAAELLTDTLDTLTYGTPFPVAGIAELSKTTENSSESHYYDNIAAIVIDSVGADEVTCSMSAIPLDVLARLTGQYYDEATKTFVEGEANRPYFAIGYVTEDTSGNEVYVWRHKVKCSIPDSTHSTKNDGTDANGQELVFTGIHTTHKFTKTGKTAKAINHEAGDLVTESAFFAAPMDIDKLSELAPAVTDIVVLPTSVSVALGSTVTLSATVTPETSTAPVTWTVTPPGGIVSVSSSGVVTPIATGTAIVTATAGTKSAYCTVTVTQGE